MNTAISLRADDFEVQNGTKGKILCCNIKGLSLVFFYSPYCNISRDLLPKFSRLPQIINGVRFCFLNINENQNVIAMSSQTISPIEFVPHIVLYFQGKPFLQYDDEPTLDKLVQFVQYSIKLVEGKKKFMEKNKIEPGGAVAKYKSGMPYMDFKCDPSGFCYLSKDDAYGKGKGGKK